tara:strand:- start:1029 stop:1196 length:168 start_codon:yes stop_codon:yes gene_type:complete
MANSQRIHINLVGSGSSSATQTTKPKKRKMSGGKKTKTRKAIVAPKARGRARSSK